MSTKPRLFVKTSWCDLRKKKLRTIQSLVMSQDFSLKTNKNLQTLISTTNTGLPIYIHYAKFSALFTTNETEIYLQ